GALALRTEVTEFAGEFGVEAVFEADLDDGSAGGDFAAVVARPLAAALGVALLAARCGLATRARVAALRAIGRRVADRDEADLALVVDLVDTDLDLLAQRQHV